ncbi:transposase [Streptomyces sp. MNP-20]|uniref:transposase n=1 Tax=Streptomyces sp. MNP-20 TaxID=2721165 RepID=UPI0020A6216E|nr:transposase [Streptomyces sp. MNP-20]
MAPQIADGVSVAVLGTDVDGAGVASKTTLASRQAAAAHGLSPRLLDELADLAAVKVRDGGLKLMGEGGLLVELTRHLMQAGVEAEMDLHLAEEAGRTGGRGSRSGSNARNGYLPRKVMTEAGTVTVQVSRDRLGTFASGLLPKYARRTGGLEEMVLSLTAKGLISGEVVAHLAEVYGTETSKEGVSTITDKALDSMVGRRMRPLDSVYPVLFVDCVNVEDPRWCGGEPSDLRGRSPATATGRSSGSGPATAARVPSSGRTFSPSCRTEACATC